MFKPKNPTQSVLLFDCERFVPSEQPACCVQDSPVLGGSVSSPTHARLEFGRGASPPRKTTTAHSKVIMLIYRGLQVELPCEWQN